MSAQDELEDMVDEQMQKELKDALTGVIEALEKLRRADRIKILTCAKMFYELPKHE